MYDRCVRRAYPPELRQLRKDVDVSAVPFRDRDVPLEDPLPPGLHFGGVRLEVEDFVGPRDGDAA